MNKRERKLIFAIIVAGKSARFAEAVMQRLFPEDRNNESYLEEIVEWYHRGVIREKLEAARTGNYTKLENAFEYICENGVDLDNPTPEKLEQIPGVGPKTSRFYILWTDHTARVAALDVHVLRWMKDKGYDVPKSTPNGKKYLEIEKLFIAEADKRGVSPRDLDFAIWAVGADHHERTPEMEELIK